MNFALINNVGKAAFSVATKVGHTVIQHSPEICVGAGIVGGVTTTVMACKATLKVNEVCTENTEMYKKIDALLEDENIPESEYSEEDAKKDRIILASGTFKTVVKSYGPVVLLGSASVASILCGVNILNRRNMALVAAYTTLDAGFKTYRRRVVDELGEEADWRFRTGTVQKKIEMEVADGETGEVKNKKVKTDVIEPGVEPIDYTINFCREAIHIRDRMDLKLSKNHIIMVENSMNSVLRAQGYLTLNTVRASLGVPEVWYGQIVGWTMDGTGDDQVKLEYRTVYDEELGHYTILIDPNVDGPMFNKIGMTKELIPDD
jgi:hypothetical protein